MKRYRPRPEERQRQRLRSTPAGEHRGVLMDAVLRVLDPKPGMTVVDCTVGWAGHSAELLARVGPTGCLVGFDMDADNIPKARERLTAVGHPFYLHHGNFAGVQQALAEHGIESVDALIADLGMSSMQVDNPQRGFSYSRDGTLDMRMDRTRGRTAAQLLAMISAKELAEQLSTLADEPNADVIARSIVQAREQNPITTTSELAKIIQAATNQRDWHLHPTPGKWILHPAARTFQALRILVNRELANLEHLLRVLPAVLKPGGRAAIISFHSGEDRLVKSAFRTGRETGIYGELSDDPVRAQFREQASNPRSRSAKLRWATRASEFK
ncbi:MAG: 16S rRNA (cytosine(1402)-N(4))-methyltransferase RsmH [Gemmataceae bacterium]|nr:16S rRNA (cytosine(1402)-N(4))-methyltransferase RsmH [Gemmataceae bacterium]